jgi:hypothetical protein
LLAGRRLTLLSSLRVGRRRPTQQKCRERSRTR